MGNSGSRPNTPGGGNSPSNEHHSQSTQKRTYPRRKESLGGYNNKAQPVAPSASIESATSHASQSHPQSNSSIHRGRSQALPSHPKDANDSSLKEHSADNTSRSKSPRPPLNVDTSSPLPSDLEPVARTASSNLSTASDSPIPFYGPHSTFGRAPRLPLPIEEEVLQPGSPAPESPSLIPTNGDVEPNGDINGVDRNISLLSATTGEDDNDLDEEATYRADDAKGPLTATLIEWKQPGERVYVTGTYCGWAKKSRLYGNGPSKDPKAFSAFIDLPPGNVYLAFLVDGIASTATHMPTTVDISGALVNYLQVPPEHTPQPVVQKDAQPARQPLPLAQDKTTSHPETALPPPTPEMRPATQAETRGAAQSSTSTPGRTLSKRQQQPTSTPPEPVEAEEKPAPKKMKKADNQPYHTDIPSYLLDWDAPERSSKLQRANAVGSTHPPPPQLPPYLQKSILTAQTPVLKDDASVLVSPNHTVLNHLATSSIKDGVLGTSATTRYKKKFVTTIMYMPTSSSGS